MSGSLVQLQTVGTQDAFLTQLPSISFWKMKTKRYTAFATEAVQCVWNNAVGFGRRSTAMLPKTGDLVSEMWLEIDLPDLSSFVPTPNTATNIRWAQAVALVMISSIQLEVGSVRLDQYAGYYHDYWSELALPYEKQAAFDRMVGKYERYDNTAAGASSAAANTYFVPLNFFVNAGTALAIPACALQFNEIRVNIELRNYLDCVRSSMAPVQSLIDRAGNPLEVSDVRLYVDFVYLSAPEKQRFISTQHDILYTYMQDSGQTAVPAGSQTAKIPLTFSNLVQEAHLRVPAEGGGDEQHDDGQRLDRHPGRLRLRRPHARGAPPASRPAPARSSTTRSPSGATPPARARRSTATASPATRSRSSPAGP